MARPRAASANDHDLVGVRIAWNESELRTAVKQSGRNLAPAAKALGDVLGGRAHTRYRSSGGHWISTAPVQARSI